MAVNVLRVNHASFANPINFSDDEIAHLDKVPIQQSFPQLSQTGALTVEHAGDEHYRFEIVFVIALRSTLTKLRTIANLQDTFQVRPALLESLEEFDVLWPNIRELREQLVRGRIEAFYELAINWEEQTAGTCPEALIGG